MDVNNISEGLKRRFCKDSNIPINIFMEPYFSNRIESFDNYYGTVRKFEIFKESLKKYDNEQDFFEDYNKTKDAAIEYIKNSDGYKYFNKEDMNRFAIPDKYKSLKSKNIYHHDNVKHRFVSIDMCSANFSSLSRYDSSIFDHNTQWYLFLERFTDNTHFLESKYMRQVILGNCNPSRHITYEKYLMTFILNEVLRYFPIEDIVSFSNDEIIIDVTLYEDKTVFRLINLLAASDFILPVKIEYFKLVKIPRGDRSEYGYIKLDRNGLYKTLKCVENEFLPIIIKKLDEKEIDDSDLYFTFKDELAKFVAIPESLENWKGVNYYDI